MDAHKTIKFKVTLGIHRRVKHVKSAGIHVFDTTICHTETFESELGSLPQNTSEIPYDLLMPAIAKADKIAAAYLAKRESDWFVNLPPFSETVWDDKPVWRGGGSVLECFKFWYDGFREAHFIKLEWEDWRKDR